MSAVRDPYKTTPSKLPSSPIRWYSVQKQQDGNPLSFSPSGKHRSSHGELYLWRVIKNDGSSQDYVGKTIQSLFKRSQQHMQRAKKSLNFSSCKDPFHRDLFDYTQNPQSNISQVKVGKLTENTAASSLSKSEQIYIEAKRSHKKKGGYNLINAHKKMHDRCTPTSPRFVLVKKDPSGRFFLIKRK